MSAAHTILPVILSGGAGSRLWPLSRREAPKQFLPLHTERTMIQETVARFDAPGFLPPVFIANADHVELIGAQVEGIGPIIVEPAGRNTAPCAVIAAAHAAAHHPSALVLLAPADHVIQKTDAFRAAVTRAAPIAAAGHHVTFGMTPDHPATGFGYIEEGDAVGGGLSAIASFREKPDAETAKAYLNSGRYHWNSGIFLFKPELVLEEMRAFEPEATAPALQAYDGADRADGVVALAPDSFAACKSVPIDIALMERTQRGAVLPCDLGWFDIGSFQALHALHADTDNVVRGDGAVRSASGVLVDTDGPRVEVVGVDGVGVIVREGRVLVVDLARSQEVKDVVEGLRASGRDALL